MTDHPAHTQRNELARNTPWLRQLLRYALRFALLLYFVFALLLIALRYFVLPHIDDYRGKIEQMLSASISLPVTIEHIEARWQELQPELVLRGFAVRDREGRPALGFDRVDAELSWRSLLIGGLRLARLEIAAPTLNIRRDASGKIFVAGLPLERQEESGGFTDWLLRQPNIVVRDATLSWQDELRQAPTLTFSKMNFHLQNTGRRHRFGLTADLPQPLARHVDVRGDFRGDVDVPFGEWSGEAYLDLNEADLAVWRAWVDYPWQVDAGSGSLRLWLSLARHKIDSVIADISLQGVQAQLGKDLPRLKLTQVVGRLSGRESRDGFAVGGKGLALSTADGIVVEPTDFEFNWYGATGKQPAHGKLTANGFDLAAASSLAAYLPLDAELRKKLGALAPRGKLYDLSLSWDKAGEQISAVNVRSRFVDLAVKAQGKIPGGSGFSGSIDGSSERGSLKIASRNAALDLPAVFPLPRLALNSITGEVSWKKAKEGIDFLLSGFSFANRDAEGNLAGKYQWRQGEAGHIDLTARLARADGTAVWRYLPYSVDKSVRDWLQHALLAGLARDATLKLRGDLKRFPFTAGDGQFEVRSKVAGASLRYADDWPQIDNIHGELAFIASRMEIKATKGSIYGLLLSDVSAQINDLEAAETLLLLKGKGSGPTSDFLRFIETSPVGEHIEHFTEEMSAVGQGRLDLAITLPLAHMNDARTQGSFQFANNRLNLGTDLPTLTELNGHIDFTGDAVRAERIRANVLGLPMVADFRTREDGTVALNAQGGFSIAALRRQFDWPLLDHLSGNSTWRLAARVRGKNADLIMDSRLVGISSSLPEPFNKITSEALPLRFERKSLAETTERRAAARTAGREQIDVALGNVASARFVRRLQPSRADAPIERGAIAIGAPLTLPEKGISIAARSRKIDLDTWRALAAQQDRQEGAGSAVQPAVQPSEIDLRAGELVLFGRRFNDVVLTASARAAAWHANIKSREAEGRLDWIGTGAGRLSGHLQHLIVRASTDSKATTNYKAEEMPALDIEVDRFQIGEKNFGHLKINAENRKGSWEAKFEIDNDAARLNGSGTWQTSGEQSGTRMEFNLHVQSVEKLLARLGYPDALRRGQATLEGRVAWNGMPIALDYPSLDGTLTILASSGQFNKLEPGAGRLLGILSLQSLPRRITLDFRDVFSQGFAFDNIGGQIDIRRGIMHTNDLRIQGPAAKVLMSGSVDLPHETQNLRVRVQPAIGESLSVGALLLAHPAIGAISYLVQKLLRDPIDQAFSYEYQVTGTWSDPKVEKLSAPQLREPAKGESAP